MTVTMYKCVGKLYVLNERLRWLDPFEDAMDIGSLKHRTRYTIKLQLGCL